MATNFYMMKDRTHVGKRSNIGGRNMKFTWAILPDSVEAHIPKLKKMLNFKCIVDSNGKKYNLREFQEVVDSCIIHRKDMIGSKFS